MTIAEYIAHLVDTDTNIPLRTFAEELHNRFYPNVDIECKEDLLELSLQDDQDKFIIPQQKLIDHGIVASHRCDIKKKLNSLDLKEDEDYIVRDSDMGRSTRKICLLTTDAFLLVLIRSSNTSSTYAKYLIFLQKVAKCYDQYQVKRSAKIMGFNGFT